MSESTNNINHPVLSPEEAMLTHEDTPEQQMARSQYAGEIRNRFTLNPRKKRYSSRNVYRLWYQNYGNWEFEDIPIKSISADDQRDIQERNSLEDYDTPDIPRVWDEVNKVSSLDTTSPEYIRWAEVLGSYLIATRYETLLCAFDGDLTSVDGSDVVWSSQDSSRRDREAALEALYALEIPSNELRKIEEAILSLSIKEYEEDTKDFLPSSTPPLESQETSTKRGRSPRRRGQRQ